MGTAEQRECCKLFSGLRQLEHSLIANIADLPTPLSNRFMSYAMKHFAQHVNIILDALVSQQVLDINVKVDFPALNVNHISPVIYKPGGDCMAHEMNGPNVVHSDINFTKRKWKSSMKHIVSGNPVRVVLVTCFQAVQVMILNSFLV